MPQYRARKVAGSTPSLGDFGTLSRNDASLMGTNRLKEYADADQAPGHEFAVGQRRVEAQRGARVRTDEDMQRYFADRKDRATSAG